MKPRSLAQTCFFTAGGGALFLFAGVETWAREIIGVMLAIACLLESSVEDPRFPKVAHWVTTTIFVLILCLLISLVPWPVDWAPWLSPGQSELLRDLLGWKPTYLHLSTASPQTAGAGLELLGFGAVVFLSWRWAGSRSFRMGLNATILAFGTLAAVIAFGDRLNGNHMFYGLRETKEVAHWGPFVNRNHFSNYLNISALVGMGLFFRYAFHRKRDPIHSVWAFIALLTSLLCMWFSLATTSKGGALSLSTGFLFLAILFAWNRSKTKVHVLLAGALLSVGIVLAYSHDVVRRTETWVIGQDSLAEGRLEVWRDALQMSRMMRGWGIGVGTFETTFPAFQTTQGHKRITHVENEYIQCWVEWGWIGTTCWVLLGVGLLNRLVSNLKHGAASWQLAGWSAGGALAVHCLVDFPLHIPAIAWTAGSLLGMLIRGHSENESSHVQKPRRGSLLLTALILGMGSLYSHFRPPNPLEHLQSQLDHQSQPASSDILLKVREAFPFFWRSHELTGYATARLPGKVREVQDSMRRSQRLSQANPMVSFRAGLLFLDANPAIGRDFFRSALSISDQPRHLFTDLVGVASQRTNGLGHILSLTTDNPDLWRLMGPKVREPGNSSILKEWLLVGERWLDHGSARAGVMQEFVASGHSTDVLEAFRRLPPGTIEERHIQALALDETSQFEEAVSIWHSLWMEKQGEPPIFPASMELNDWVLKKALSEEVTPEFRLKVGETCMATGRFSEAIPIFRRILATQPDSMKPSYALVLCLEHAKDWAAASKIWKTLIQVPAESFP